MKFEYLLVNKGKLSNKCSWRKINRGPFGCGEGWWRGWWKVHALPFICRQSVVTIQSETYLEYMILLFNHNYRNCIAIPPLDIHIEAHWGILKLSWPKSAFWSVVCSMLLHAYLSCFFPFLQVSLGYAHMPLTCIDKCGSRADSKDSLVGTFKRQFQRHPVSLIHNIITSIDRLVAAKPSSWNP